MSPSAQTFDESLYLHTHRPEQKEVLFYPSFLYNTLWASFPFSPGMMGLVYGTPASKIGVVLL